MPDIHAKLSASSSHRWLACPKSIALEGKFPAEVSSPYAEEGTRAHEMAQLILKNIINNEIVSIPVWLIENLQVSLKEAPETDDLKELINTFGTPEIKEMLSFIMVYVKKCVAVYENSKANYADTVAYIEERLDYSNYAPKGFGTGDFVCIGGNRITVIDLKYGRGVKVEATDNSQLKLYALGAYGIVDFLYDITEIESIIVQPRIPNGISYFLVDTKTLLNWAENILKPKALLAYRNEGEYQPGDHCKFCKANGSCRAQLKNIISILKKYGGQANV